LLVIAFMSSQDDDKADNRLETRYKVVQQLQKAADASGYQVEKLRTALTSNKKSTVMAAKK